MSIIKYLALCLAVLAPAQAWADECKGVILKDIPQLQGDGRTGTIVEGLHEYRGKPDGTPISYEVEDGDIYAADHIRILNCSINKISSYPFYKLTLTNTPENALDIIYKKITEKLIALGLCKSCATNAADAYLREPKGLCGIKVLRALGGDRSAAGDLSDTDGCQ